MRQTGQPPPHQRAPPRHTSHVHGEDAHRRPRPEPLTIRTTAVAVTRHAAAVTVATALLRKMVACQPRLNTTAGWGSLPARGFAQTGGGEGKVHDDRERCSRGSDHDHRLRAAVRHGRVGQQLPPPPPPPRQPRRAVVPPPPQPPVAARRRRRPPPSPRCPPPAQSAPATAARRPAARRARPQMPVAWSWRRAGGGARRLPPRPPVEDGWRRRRRRPVSSDARWRAAAGEGR